MNAKDTLCHLESDYNNGAQEGVMRHLLETNTSGHRAMVTTASANRHEN